jgi:hypothetical protein
MLVIYVTERDLCKQYNKFIPVIDTGMKISTAMDREGYNAATNEKSTSANENFSFGGILSKGNPFALSEQELAR